MRAMLLAVFLLATALAQPSIDGDLIIYGAYGDLPQTETVETLGQWHHQSTVKAEINGTGVIVVPRFPGFSADSSSIECTPDCTVLPVAGETPTSRPYEVTTGNDTAVEVTLKVTFAGRTGLEFFATRMTVPDGTNVIMALPATLDVVTDLPEGSESGRLPNTFDASLINYYATQVPGNTYGFAVLPAGSIPEPSTTVIPADNTFPWAPVGLALVLGMVVWAMLVKQGLVQSKRRQQVQKASHEVLLESESKSTLEGRKRVLMAGLKELDLAKNQAGIEDSVYDELRAELKKEAVSVLRALETAE